MQSVIPANEAARMAAVRRYDILDTPPDGMFDRVTALAAWIFKVPIAIVSVVDQDRIWFKSHHGVDVTEIGRDPGLCASAILSDDPRILPDARRDPHALSNPLVAGAFGLRFYAGVPLRTFDGYNLGTLCVIDTEPRDVTDGEMAHLRDLAAIIMDQLELRRSARSAVGVKDELIREINHRVGNSLQLVSSLLRIQRRGQPVAVAEQFDIAAGRIAAIGRVHRRLYRTDQVAFVEFKQFLSEICDEIASSLALESQGPTLIVDADRADLPTDRAISLALIVNELITNAMKHAFPEGETGTIAISFRVAAEGYELVVADDGVGVRPGFEVNASDGLGMRLSTSLAEQIDGTLQIGPGAGGRGTRASIRIA